MLLCFTVLFAQLGVLHYLDLRILNAERQEANAVAVLDEREEETSAS